MMNLNIIEKFLHQERTLLDRRGADKLRKDCQSGSSSVKEEVSAWPEVTYIVMIGRI